MPTCESKHRSSENRIGIADVAPRLPLRSRPSAPAVIAFLLPLLVAGCGGAVTSTESPRAGRREFPPVDLRPAPQPQTAIVRFRIRHSPQKWLPETEFGQLLVERTTGRCVYHYWYDGVHDVPRNDKLLRVEDVHPENPLVDRYRSTFKGAAGFDGERFWAASYGDDLVNEHRARRIVVFDGKEDLREFDYYLGMSGPTWYSLAPLHKLLRTIDVDTLERDAICKAFAASPHFHDSGGGVFREKSPPAEWSIGVVTDQSELGIARIDIDQKIVPRTGSRPWSPAFGSYSLTCENADDVDTRSLTTLVDLHTYVGEGTEVIDARDAIPWNRPQQ